MADNDIFSRIDQLVEEEHALRGKATGEGLSTADQERLTGLETELDQCWDLLRQRRARAEFGENPEDTTVRPTRQVESYLQ